MFEIGQTYKNRNGDTVTINKKIKKLKQTVYIVSNQRNQTYGMTDDCFMSCK